MKLRLRNLETKETLKIEAPEPCTLLRLKLIVADRASLSSSPLFLSLNRKDELSGSNPDTDTLASLGVTSGDLIFFSLDPDSFISQTRVAEFGSGSVSREKGVSGLESGGNGEKVLIDEPELVNEEKTLVSQFSSGGGGVGIGGGSVSREKGVIVERKSSCLGSGRNEGKALIGGSKSIGLESDRKEVETLVIEHESISSETGRHERENLIVGTNSENNFPESGGNKTLESDTQMEETLINEKEITQKHDLARNSELGVDDVANDGGTIGMELDGADDVADAGTGKGFSVPAFLRKVFNKELGDSGGCDHKLVVIAVHAVLKESGFLGFDTASNTRTHNFYLPDVWPLSGFTLSLCYTLPEIAESSGAVETVVLKVKSLGKDVVFYGSLAGKRSGIYRVCLDEDRLAIMLNLMWANLDTPIEKSGSVIYPEKEVFEFWKTVKDKLALPLLIDLCEVANLPPPSCFTRLPTDLKLGILELLPGADVAKAACVSPELRFLSSYDDLWKKKFLEEFGNAEVAEGSVAESSWKRKFVKAWEARKRRRRTGDVARGPPIWVPSNYRDPAIFRFPRIIGGDYDMGPNIMWGGGNNLNILRGGRSNGMAPDILRGGRPSRRQPGMDFIPPCNFGNRRA